MPLPDPRHYPPVNARNPVIRQLMSLMTAREDTTILAKRAELLGMLTDLLVANDHAAINAALTQAPAQEAWQTLWQALCDVIETPPANGPKYSVTLFALPVIVVAASTQGTTLPGTLSDPAKILHILRQYGILEQDAMAFLAPELISAESMAVVSPATRYDWKIQLPYSFENEVANPFGLEGCPISVKEESAWLRFIVGGIRQTQDLPSSIRLGGLVGKWGLSLSQELSEQLKSADATVLAMPRAPQTWQAAQENGRTILLETRLQLLASNAIRTIRSKGRTPVVVIAAHENNEIRITFSSQEDAERWQGFVWPLSPADQVEHIAQFAQTLARDCQVSDIRVIDTIQPDREGELPFFVTAHFAPIIHH